MRYFFLTLIIGFSASGCLHAEQDAQQRDILNRLELYLPNENTKRDLGILINGLDSDSYSERNQAFNELADRPAISSYIRQLEEVEKRPEVRSRMTELIKLSSIERESNTLDDILKDISQNKIKGTLEWLVPIIQKEIWKPNNSLLHQAARDTVTLNDIPLIKREISNKSIAVRRLIAAALGGLPNTNSLPLLLRLLSDPSDRVSLIATLSLARQNNKACLPALAKLLNSSDFYTRYQSWSALKSLSGKSFGYSPTVEKSKREKASAAWRKWAAGPNADIGGELREIAISTLFNGMDLTGWDVYENGKIAPKQTSWTVKDGQIVCLGVNRGDIRTQQRFENFVLSLEYKVTQQGGDGGIGVMLTKENEVQGAGIRGDAGRYLEVQILPGNAGDVYSIGNFKAKVRGGMLNFSSPRFNNVDDPPAQWHRLKLTVANGNLKVEINGKLVNEATQGSKGPGKIIIRNEGGKIAYKNLELLPLQE